MQSRRRVLRCRLLPNSAGPLTHGKSGSRKWLGAAGQMTAWGKARVLPGVRRVCQTLKQQINSPPQFQSWTIKNPSRLETHTRIIEKAIITWPTQRGGAVLARVRSRCVSPCFYEGDGLTDSEQDCFDAFDARRKQGKPHDTQQISDTSGPRASP